MKKLTLADIDRKFVDKVSVQNYQPKKKIEGVKIISLKIHSGEDGTFEELLRVSDQDIVKALPNFKIRQINRSEILPGKIKGWHLHFNQEDVWYLSPNDHVMVGLWDLRENSPTKGLKMRAVMGANHSQLLLIPRGVAHGVVNLGEKTATIIYFINQRFDPHHPDEQRLPWDSAGADFWQPKRE